MSAKPGSPASLPFASFSAYPHCAAALCRVLFQSIFRDACSSQDPYCVRRVAHVIRQSICPRRSDVPFFHSWLLANLLASNASPLELVSRPARNSRVPGPPMSSSSRGCRKNKDKNRQRRRRRKEDHGQIKQETGVYPPIVEPVHEPPVDSVYLLYRQKEICVSFAPTGAGRGSRAEACDVL